MVTIPISFLLIIFALFLIVITVFFVTDLMHLTLTGTINIASFLLTLFVLAGSLLILFATWYLLKDVDWSQGITIWNSEWINFNQTI